MLHLTNGDCAASLIQQTGLLGEVLPWRDLLHEGPTPADLSLAQLREVRARFIAGWNGWVVYDEVLADFARRDDTLARFQEYEDVVLWFEHDLYDQLQLIQILDWFSRHDLGKTQLSLICIDTFPGIEPFRGLGQLNPVQMSSLYETRHRISEAELTLGRSAWQSFRSPDPTAIKEFLSRDTSALPFLRNALARHLEQFPSVANGLSRTERQLLEAIEAGAQSPVEIFRANMQQENYFFVGDIEIWNYLHNLCAGREPLLRVADSVQFTLPWQFQTREEFLAQSFTLTEQGRNVLRGQGDWIELNGIDRWLGGVHLRNEDALWRWDEQRRRLTLV